MLAPAWCKSNQPERIEIHLPPRGDVLVLIRRFFADLCAQVGFGDDDTEKVVMAVDEALANSIDHNSKSEESIAICIDISPTTLTITVEDSGCEFGEQFHRDFTLDDHLSAMKTSGLGLHIIRSFMDSVDYVRHPEARNLLKLIKFLPQGKDRSDHSE